MKDSATIFSNDSIPFIILEEGSNKSIKDLATVSSELSVPLLQHYQKIPYYNGIQKVAFSQAWILILLVVLFAGLAYAKAIYSKRFNLLAKTVINWKVAKSIIRFEKVYSHPVNLILNTIFILSAALFLGLCFSIKYSNQPLDSYFFLGLLGPITSYLISKLILYKFSGWIISDSEIIEEYVFQANLFNKILGVILLLINSLLIYSSINAGILISIGFSSFLLLFFLQLTRGVFIGREKGVKYLPIILYLCTLEILPWLILIKLVKTLL